MPKSKFRLAIPPGNDKQPGGKKKKKKKKKKTALLPNGAAVRIQGNKRGFFCCVNCPEVFVREQVTRRRRPCKVCNSVAWHGPLDFAEEQPGGQPDEYKPVSQRSTGKAQSDRKSDSEQHGGVRDSAHEQPGKRTAAVAVPTDEEQWARYRELRRHAKRLTRAAAPAATSERVR